MTVKALSFRTDESEIAKIKKAASMFQMSVAGLMREAVKDYIERRQKERFFESLKNVEEASPEESAEILEMIENMTDDDWETVSFKKVVTGI